MFKRNTPASRATRDNVQTLSTRTNTTGTLVKSLRRLSLRLAPSGVTSKKPSKSFEDLPFELLRRIFDEVAVHFCLYNCLLLSKALYRAVQETLYADLALLHYQTSKFLLIHRLWRPALAAQYFKHIQTLNLGWHEAEDETGSGFSGTIWLLQNIRPRSLYLHFRLKNRWSPERRALLRAALQDYNLTDLGIRCRPYTISDVMELVAASRSKLTRLTLRHAMESELQDHPGDIHDISGLKESLCGLRSLRTDAEGLRGLSLFDSGYRHYLSADHMPELEYLALSIAPKDTSDYDDQQSGVEYLLAQHGPRICKLELLVTPPTHYYLPRDFFAICPVLRTLTLSTCEISEVMDASTSLEHLRLCYLTLPAASEIHLKFKNDLDRILLPKLRKLTVDTYSYEDYYSPSGEASNLQERFGGAGWEKRAEDFMRRTMHDLEQVLLRRGVELQVTVTEYPQTT